MLLEEPVADQCRRPAFRMCAEAATRGTSSRGSIHFLDCDSNVSVFRICSCDWTDITYCFVECLCSSVHTIETYADELNPFFSEKQNDCVASGRKCYSRIVKFTFGALSSHYTCIVWELV